MKVKTHSLFNLILGIHRTRPLYIQILDNTKPKNRMTRFLQVYLQKNLNILYIYYINLEIVPFCAA